MRRCILAGLIAATLHGAVIRGTVLESQTGHVLSRATVVVEPVPGSAGTRLSARTNRFGFFEFVEPPGTYLLQASREYFFSAQYGQKRWNSAGMPLVLTEEGTTFVTFKLLRFAAIAGRVVDENDVGMPEFDVSAYLDVRPPQLVASAHANERGEYRIYGLLPGSYLVRTGGKEQDDIGYKPTFGREADVVDQARSVDVDIEQQVERMDLRPLPGQLASLSVGATTADPPDMPVTLTMAGEMGRQTVKSASYTFRGLTPGFYEVFAEAPSDPPGTIQGAYQRVSVGRDTSVGLTLHRIQPVTFRFDGLSLQAGSDASLKLLGRRKDMAGSHDTQVIKLVDNRAWLPPGPWQFALAPPDGYYVAGFSGPGAYRREAHNEGWNDCTIISGGTVIFALSGNVSSLHGMVKDHGDLSIGAPVYLEPVDLDPARRIANAYVAISDLHGQYRFPGLAPGRYRLLSTFEYQMPDAKTMTNAGAKELQIDSRSDVTADLDLYVIR